MARTKSSRLNLAGVFSIIIGAAAFAVPYIPQVPVSSMIVAMAGLAVGLIGLLVSLSSGRTNSGVPIVGIIVCLAALGFDSYNNGGALSRWAHSKSDTPAAPPPAEAPPVVVPSYSGSGTSSSHSNNIFGIPTGGPDSTGTTATPAPSSTAIPPVHHDVTPSATPGVPFTPSIQQPAQLSVLDARVKLDAATAAVEHTLSNDPAYRAAKADVAAAEGRKKAALAASGPGSAEVLETAQELLDAKAKLQKLIAAAAAKDPLAQAARHDLADAEKSARKK